MSAGWTKEPGLSAMSSQAAALAGLRAVLRSGPTRSSVPWQRRRATATRLGCRVLAAACNGF